MQGEEDGGGVVVDGDGGGAQEFFEQAGDVGVALAALAGGEVVFEIGVARQDGAGSERGATEIGVEHDAGGIDDAAERGALEGGEGGEGAIGGGGLGGVSGCDFAAEVVEGAADLGGNEGAGEVGEGSGDALDEVVDRGQLAEWWAIGHEFDGMRLCRRGATDYTRSDRGVAQPG